MSESRTPPPDDDFGGQIIDIDPPGPASERKPRRWAFALVLLIPLFALTRAGSIYLETLWYGSLGYSSIYWTSFKYEWAVFVAFALATTVLLRGAFLLLERSFAVTSLAPRRVLLNNEPVFVKPARLLKPAAWVVSLLLGLFYGLGMSEGWQTFALWLNRPRTEGADPIFGNSLGFYLFTLPAVEALSAWLLTLAWVVLLGALVYAALGLIPTGTNIREAVSSRGALTSPGARGAAYAAVSAALAVLLSVLALRAYLSRYSYLFDDHQIFSGVTYTEDHWVLPGLAIVSIALVLGAALALANAFVFRRARPLAVAVALPVLVYLVAVVLIPGYVQSFVVKPNELDRESVYIGHNMEATRRAFNLERVEARDFPADNTDDAYAIDQNRPTLDNLRIWDYHALQDTLRQVQEIRTYYDFNDVDIDRYKVGGQTRQVMLAPRELDIAKLPASSRGNWINERLIYTHGYGVTMSTANGFTPEGRPEFLLSNMPSESNAPEIKLTRPQIYFGEKTDTTVYVNTRQKEFDYPQGDANASTVYEGTGGFPIGGTLRRLVLAWELEDTSRLPFADDVTPESRVLMRRNISERLRTLAPFLRFDEDPYIVLRADGSLSWMVDAYTTSEMYPYARHHAVGAASVNYVRNSVKATVDAYTGAVAFYVFDREDPVLGAYRSLFPALFRDASAMPEDLRAHVRYPEALLKTQAEAYGLYHTENAKVFFQREDVWSVARESAPKQGGEASALEPYYALLQLPGGQSSAAPPAPEFVDVVAFTPASRDNLIGWMAGRSDGDSYGSLLVYKFPKTKLVNGPLQVNARIDQNAQLSSQLTLWNQQGSRVQRGNLLVVPLGRGLLYVQAIYLQAEHSPMPELRLVVLATQDRLAFGTSFPDALAKLFGHGEGSTQQGAKQDSAPTSKQGGATETPSPTATTQELIDRAAADLSDYQRLTAEGKLGEAGQKLESLKRTLDELQKAKQ
ncbi:MAG: uncharacterized protein QOH51_1975 [Acidobacteriota bacterium]|jgi:uncharacterized membrane protein (UPF0182 family)|nr:uncharacterized protein [Acidobacteriota bacterium]